MTLRKQAVKSLEDFRVILGIEYYVVCTGSLIGEMAAVNKDISRILPGYYQHITGILPPGVVWSLVESSGVLC